MLVCCHLFGPPLELSHRSSFAEGAASARLPQHLLYSPLISLFFLLAVSTPNFLLSSQQSLLLVFNFPVSFPTLLGALIFLISLLPVISPHMKTGSPQCEVHALSISSHLCVPWTDRCAKSGHQRGEKCLRPLLSNFRRIRIIGRYCAVEPRAGYFLVLWTSPMAQW